LTPSQRLRIQARTFPKRLSKWASTAVETIGEGYHLGWRVMVRCAWGPRDGMKRMRLWRGIGHGDPRLDARAGFPDRDAGEPIAMPSVPVAAGAGGIQTFLPTPRPSERREQRRHAIIMHTSAWARQRTMLTSGMMSDLCHQPTSSEGHATATYASCGNVNLPPSSVEGIDKVAALEATDEMIA
jgi:hypothetical protein